MTVLVAILCFQNCNKSGSASNPMPVAFSANTNNAITATPTATPACPDILCTVNMSQVSTITFTGSYNTSVIGTYGVSVVLNIDNAASTFTDTESFTGPTAAINLGTCSGSGTKANFSALENALQALTFTATQPTNPTVALFGSATLTLGLTDGTSKTFAINSQSTNVNVGGLTNVNGFAFVTQMASMVSTGSCSSSIMSFL